LKLGLIERSDQRKSERRDRHSACRRVDDGNRRTYPANASRRGEQVDRDLLRQRIVCRVFRRRKNQDRLAINPRPDDIEESPTPPTVSNSLTLFQRFHHASRKADFAEG
jgi:hypothetical protein